MLDGKFRFYVPAYSSDEECRVPADKSQGTGIHWQVAQATSLMYGRVIYLSPHYQFLMAQEYCVPNVDSIEYSTSRWVVHVSDLPLADAYGSGIWMENGRWSDR
jgi:hypothetical protein